YLKLSDFDSKLAGKLNYYVLGSLFGFGKIGQKHRAAEHDIWAELRSLAYFGLCDAERKLSLFDQAIEHCQRSLIYYPSDPFAHFALAASYMAQAANTGNIAELSTAKTHFRQVIEINPYLDEAKHAKANLDQIEKA